LRLPAASSPRRSSMTCAASMTSCARRTWTRRPGHQGTTLTGLSGVGEVVAATVIGDVRDVSRFPGRDHFAATYSRTALVRLGGQPRILGRKAPLIGEGSSGWRHSACSPWMWSRRNIAAVRDCFDYEPLICGSAQIGRFCASAGLVGPRRRRMAVDAALAFRRFTSSRRRSGLLDRDLVLIPTLRKQAT